MGLEGIMLEVERPNKMFRLVKGNVRSKIYDCIFDLKEANGYIYAKIEEKGLKRIVKLNPNNLKEEACSRDYDWIKDFQAIDREVYVIVSDDSEKERIIKLDEILKEVARSEPYEEIVKILNESFAIVKDEDMYRVIKLDENLKEVRKSRKFEWIEKCVIDDKKIYAEVKDWGLSGIIVMDENLEEEEKYGLYYRIKEWKVIDGKVDIRGKSLKEILEGYRRLMYLEAERWGSKPPSWL